MLKKPRWLFSIFLILMISSSAALALEILPTDQTSMSSSTGEVFLKESLNTNTLKLLSHFNGQTTGTNCGVASSIIVLNALNHITPPVDERHPAYLYFTQDNFFTDEVKKIINIEKFQKNGLILSEVKQALDLFGAHPTVFYANELTLDEFKSILKKAIAENQFIIADFHRGELSQKGGGHYSPIAAYHEKSDQFLILEVAQHRYPPFWVSAEKLWKAVNTIDKSSGTSRGIILIPSE